MRTRRTRRIGPTEADRLVAGNPPDPDHRGLGVLLDAATAPPSVEELAGETAAVARYVAAFRATAAEPAARDRVRVPRSAKMIVTKVAAGVAILTAGGTAVAAETGNFPAGVQHFFSALGVPAPDGGPQPTATGAGPAPSRGSATPSPTPAPSRSGATPRPAETTALVLCRAWDDTRQKPGNPMPAASRRALAAAAGGEKKIDGFCASLLAMSAAATTGQPGTGTGTGSGSTGNNGNGNGDDNGGNDNGNGNTGGNGNGHGKGHPSPSPTQGNSRRS
jgi:hypothetical protein